MDYLTDQSCSITKPSSLTPIGPDNLLYQNLSYLDLKIGILEFSLNGAELSLNSANSENLRNHWNMNWVQFKDPLCYLCLCDAVISSLCLTRDITWVQIQQSFWFLIFFCHWSWQIQWKHLGKTQIAKTKTDWGHLDLNYCSLMNSFNFPAMNFTFHIVSKLEHRGQLTNWQ